MNDQETKSPFLKMVASLVGSCAGWVGGRYGATDVRSASAEQAAAAQAEARRQYWAQIGGE